MIPFRALPINYGVPLLVAKIPSINDDAYSLGILASLLGRRQANLCFHFAGSGENLPDIAKSRGTSMDNKEFSSLLLPVLSHKLPFLS